MAAHGGKEPAPPDSVYYKLKSSKTAGSQTPIAREKYDEYAALNTLSPDLDPVSCMPLRYGVCLNHASIAFAGNMGLVHEPGSLQ